MTPLSGQIENAGHFLQPATTAIGHKVMGFLLHATDHHPDGLADAPLNCTCVGKAATRRYQISSNSCMQTTNEIDSRLANLEIKASFTEDLVEELNRTVFRQQEQIDLLLRRVARLQQQSPHAADSATGHGLDELPPHY